MIKSRFSVVIITLNACRTLERCLLSLPSDWDKVIIDSGSDDETEKIASCYNVRFYFNPWPGFSKQRIFGANLTQSEWLLFLDADEWLSPRLTIELLNLDKERKQYDAIEFKRKSIFKGKVIHHGDWSSDFVVRLIKKKKMNWSGSEPHPYLDTKGLVVSRCKEYLMHEPYASNTEFKKKITAYARIAAKGTTFHKITTITSINFYLRTLWRFFRSYFVRFGFLDGYAGLTIALYNSQMVLLKYSEIKKILTTKKS